jgi:hypothetical protein
VSDEKVWLITFCPSWDEDDSDPILVVKESDTLLQSAFELLLHRKREGIARVFGDKADYLLPEKGWTFHRYDEHHARYEMQDGSRDCYWRATLLPFVTKERGR